MKAKLIFIIKYFFFWVGLFLVQKLLFLFYNHQESFSISLKDWLLILLNGLKLDLSMTAYLLAIPVLLLSFGMFFSTKFLRIFVNIYTYILLFIILYLGVVDMALYSYWGFKLDITPLLYIKTPGDALASVEAGQIIFLLSIFAVLYLVFIYLFRKFFRLRLDTVNEKWYYTIPAGILGIMILFVFARGGFGVAAMNLSRVYFHKERFANHSAINVTWNAIYSFIEREKLQEHFRFMDEHQALEKIALLNTGEQNEKQRLVKPGANVLLFILESFSNKIISSFGGETGITPNLDSLCSNSVIFTNFYASGDRSDKGLVSIYSGYPAQPTTSIIDYPSKSQKLPFLYEKLEEQGYSTAFYYGGDLNFANFKSYFSNPALQKLVTKENFSHREQSQKWGVPDGILFERLLADLSSSQEPFFYSCFTLSSHEPFDVPMDPVFGTANRDDLSKNGFYYTDRELGKFLASASLSEWWDNTLVIITADHGSRSPGNTSNHSLEKFRIPMIWTGGALIKKGLMIGIVGSQTDIPATLLGQLNYEYKEFPYSKDLLSQKNGYAFYAFNNGFGLATNKSYVIYDNDFERCIVEEGMDTDTILETGKAFLQILSNDFIHLK